MSTLTNSVTGADTAIVGVAADGVGVLAKSTHGEGLHGESSSAGAAAVAGIALDAGPGVYGVSERYDGVIGIAKAVGKAGVAGRNENGIGVFGYSKENEAVHGETHSSGMAAIAARNLNDQGTGAALYAEKLGEGGHAGMFIGHVRVTRNFSVGGEIQMTGGDLAEQFGVAGESVAAPGHVMVLVGDDQVRQSTDPYDTRVAGIVSGAGTYRPGLVLDARLDTDRCALALTGKAWCWVDADLAPVALGDLLTTSSTPGHAMRASDPARAFGAVIGKSLGALTAGRALLPVLVGLR